MDSLKTWPERIYLQCGDDSSEPGDTPDYADCHDITWEAEKINTCDVAYVRADLATHAENVSSNAGNNDTIASELDKVTVDKCAYLAKKGMRFVGAVMTDVDGRRATIDMGRVTWSDAPDPLQELADQAQALGMGYGPAGWIAFSERRPEKGDRILMGITTYYTNAPAGFSEFIGVYGKCGNYRDPSHWMPLPKPPEAMLLKCDKP